MLSENLFLKVLNVALGEFTPYYNKSNLKKICKFKILKQLRLQKLMAQISTVSYIVLILNILNLKHSRLFAKHVKQYKFLL